MCGGGSASIIKLSLCRFWGTLGHHDTRPRQSRPPSLTADDKPCWLGPDTHLTLASLTRVRYHRTADSLTSEPIRLAAAMPTRPASERDPGFHIHCRFGNLNDPNGLVYHDGQYHLFHQYAYGPRGKHWAHYVTSDFIHWEERPIGLFPDQTGSMHSGSA